MRDRLLERIAKKRDELSSQEQARVFLRHEVAMDRIELLQQVIAPRARMRAAFAARRSSASGVFVAGPVLVIVH